MFLYVILDQRERVFERSSCLWFQTDDAHVSSQLCICWTFLWCSRIYSNSFGINSMPMEQDVDKISIFPDTSFIKWDKVAHRIFLNHFLDVLNNPQRSEQHDKSLLTTFSKALSSHGISVFWSKFLWSNKGQIYNNIATNVIVTNRWQTLIGIKIDRDLRHHMCHNALQRWLLWANSTRHRCLDQTPQCINDALQWFHDFSHMYMGTFTSWLPTLSILPGGIIHYQSPIHHGCLASFSWRYIDGILPKGPYPPCLRVADRALLAGYPRYGVRYLGSDNSFVACWAPRCHLNQCWLTINWTPGTNFSESSITIEIFSLNIMHFRMSSFFSMLILLKSVTPTCPSKRRCGLLNLYSFFFSLEL